MPGPEPVRIVRIRNGRGIGKVGPQSEDRGCAPPPRHGQTPLLALGLRFPSGCLGGEITSHKTSGWRDGSLSVSSELVARPPDTNPSAGITTSRDARRGRHPTSGSSPFDKVGNPRASSAVSPTICSRVCEEEAIPVSKAPVPGPRYHCGSRRFVGRYD